MLNYDREHIWHPYTSMADPLPVYPVRGADGVWIELEDGQRLIDGMSSWWCAVHGYNHPALNMAAHGQIDRFAHMMFGGLTHRPAVELAERLLAIVPEGLTRVFYSDSGSVAVEVAAKMALQYAQAQGFTRRTKLATVAGGYHGDTWHAMSVCDPAGGMHTLWAGRLPVQFFAPRPPREWSVEAFEPMRRMLARHADEIAAVVIEPAVQGAGGMWFYAPEYLAALREECTRHGILLIADEIASGFWRTGRRWGVDWADTVENNALDLSLPDARRARFSNRCALGVHEDSETRSTTFARPSARGRSSQCRGEDESVGHFCPTTKQMAARNCAPDIMCLGKALTGGYMSFAATLTTDEVAMGISRNEPHVFMHGPTFMGNPLACAVACASLDLLENPALPGRIARIETLLRQYLQPARKFSGVADVRVLGAIGVVEMREAVDVGAFQRRCVERGVWIRPFGRLVYVMPPYIITDTELQTLCENLVELVR